MGIATEALLWRAVDRLRVPTLLVRGEHSPLLTSDAADRMVRRLAHGRRVDVNGGGHDLGVEQPEPVAAVVSAFLASDPADPTQAKLGDCARRVAQAADAAPRGAGCGRRHICTASGQSATMPTRPWT